MDFVYVRLGASCPDANAPLLAMTWWFTVSVFFQMTESPPATVTAFGTNPVDLMFTVLVAVNAATAKPAPARAQTAVAIVRNFLIGGSP
jgi:tetraacyldisaccharide-1-P 4'-kinase